MMIPTKTSIFTQLLCIETAESCKRHVVTIWCSQLPTERIYDDNADYYDVHDVDHDDDDNDDDDDGDDQDGDDDDNDDDDHNYDDEHDNDDNRPEMMVKMRMLTRSKNG